MTCPLEEQPTWMILDASKIQDYMMCPRRFFYSHVLGWTPILPNVHLEFGTAWHLAMEVLLRQGYTEEALAEALKRFLSHYRQYFDPTWDEGNSPKNPVCAAEALRLYCDQYQDDNFTVLHIEVSGSVAIAANRVLYFKTDSLNHGLQGYFSQEHKTGSRFSQSWAAQWRQKFQGGVYNHVLYCLYPESEVWGVQVNGVFPKPPPKLKKNGEPYANALTTEFHRVPVRRNPESMGAWLEEANYWYSRVEQDFDALVGCRDADPSLCTFRRNTENCTKYGVCPFLDYCALWHNPLQHVDQIPASFHVEHWDPRSPEYAKEVMEL